MIDPARLSPDGSAWYATLDDRGRAEAEDAAGLIRRALGNGWGARELRAKVEYNARFVLSGSKEPKGSRHWRGLPAFMVDLVDQAAAEGRPVLRLTRPGG